MAQPVAALGVAMVTVSGCVWYLPALVDLRAGADRPDSRRTAAAACLSGWSTTAVIALLLFLAEAWWAPAAAAVTGTAVTAVLRGRALVQRRREARQTARDWTELCAAPAPAGPRRGPRIVAGLLGGGLCAAAATAVLRSAPAGEGGPHWPSLALAPAGIVAVSVVLAAICAGRARRRAP
ncbi:hypothetical protein [Streptomyces sp. DSM 15324]|uniref:hypothetical protein n=1 Tax=Streptomyces sp. DSM 15324 TaxID=1739111 RepID=UPI000746D4E1|nr:hypothetical protein [Streptomyces sp. DSM 15324]KUO09591.1 hypothetical protein AQJ58_23835 [Streptomyces sp. DSM 15324]